MDEQILLVEPDYKTKYPPLGLMKLSTYHKLRGDKVTFVRGCHKYVRDQYWDRVYITTLFTWTWKKTVKTIKFYHDTIFAFSSKLYIGGILASLMPQELFNATGIYPHVGLLDSARKIGYDDDTKIDELPPDYDVTKQVERNGFKYAYIDAYIGYATRGCIRNCEFCAVRTFEPEYIDYVDIKQMVQEVTNKHGEKQNLLLMDNNVLASNRFHDIIDDIKKCGFVKGAKFGPTKRRRLVDFNQGLDARLLDEHKMKRFAEIPLDPMRIGFDDIGLKETYVRAVRLAHQYGQVNMSNYVLYNFKDTPEDFYDRLKINVDLNDEFAHDGSGVKTVVYSFPMRYIPLDAKTRHVDTGNKHWNKRYLRSVQAILNVTKGPVMPGKEFFEQAFGRNPEEFKAIMLMPEDFIRFRVCRNWRDITDWEKRLMPYVREWLDTYWELSEKERQLLVEVVGSNDRKWMKEKSTRLGPKNIRKLVNMHMNGGEIVTKYTANAVR